MSTEGGVVETLAPAVPAAPSTGRKRARRADGKAREHRLALRLDDNELAVVAEAAARAGLTPTGYAAAAALSAARGTLAPGAPTRDVLLQLVQARTALGKIGANLNQLAAAANSGEMPAAPQLLAYFRRVQDIALAVEAAAADVRRRLL